MISQQLWKQKRTSLSLLLVLVALTLAVGCKGKTAGDVMAKVNGRNITNAEVEKYYSNQTAGAPQQPTEEPNTNPIVRVVEDAPDFLGTDEKTYSLRKEDVLSLPKETGDLLLKKGMVKQVK